MSTALLDRKSTLIRIPAWLHRQLRLEAANVDRSMNEIVIEELAGRYTDPASPFFLPQAELQHHDGSELNNTYVSVDQKVTAHEEAAQPAS